jgi:predicted SAM-dependent methyltransferase
MPNLQSTETLRLHIGGIEPKPGWKILNAIPGEHVDFLGDINDLSGFAANSVEEVYASHVLEHVGQGAILRVLQEIFRILKPGGRFMVSVPDMEVLCTLHLQFKNNLLQRVHVMRMMFGGQTDAYDFHYIGLDFELLATYLTEAGFADIQRVNTFGLFDDTSNYVCYGRAISLNVVAVKN